MKLYVQPISLMCGHTFCRSCIRRSLAVQQCCPLCRFPCFINVKDSAPNFLISRLIASRYGEELAARIPEVEQDEVELDSQHLGLFYLPDAGVMFPGAPVNLLVFEPRFLLLIQRCMDNQVPFGIAEGPQTTTGVCVKVEQVKRAPGNRLVVAGVAQSRFRSMRPPQEEEGAFGLQYVPAAFLSDEPVSGVTGACVLDRNAPELAALTIRSRRLLAACSNDTQRAALLKAAMATMVVRVVSELGPSSFRVLLARYGPPPPTAGANASPERWSYYLADVLDLSPEVKKAAFESTITLQRLLLCYAYLERMEQEVASGGGAGPAVAPLAETPEGELDACRSLRAVQIMVPFVRGEGGTAGSLAAGVKGLFAFISGQGNSPVASLLLLFVLCAGLYWYATHRNGMEHYRRSPFPAGF